MILILTTINSKSKAKQIGKILLQKRLIACYNLFPVESSYWWHSKIEESNEILMILKTEAANFSKIEKIIKDESGYKTPEVVSIKPAKISQNYLKWLKSEVK